MPENDATLIGRTYQSNEARLSTDGKEICAMIGPDPVQGIAGYCPSVPRRLAGLGRSTRPIRCMDRGDRSEPSVARIILTNGGRRNLAICPWLPPTASSVPR